MHGRRQTPVLNLSVLSVRDVRWRSRPETASNRSSARLDFSVIHLCPDGYATTSKQCVPCDIRPVPRGGYHKQNDSRQQPPSRKQPVRWDTSPAMAVCACTISWVAWEAVHVSRQPQQHIPALTALTAKSASPDVCRRAAQWRWSCRWASIWCLSATPNPKKQATRQGEYRGLKRTCMTSWCRPTIAWYRPCRQHLARQLEGCLRQRRQT